MPGASSAAAPRSDAVITEGKLALLAGQGPIQNGRVVGGPIAEQTRVTLSTSPPSPGGWARTPPGGEPHVLPGRPRRPRQACIELLDANAEAQVS